MKSNTDSVIGVHPPDFRDARPGIKLFEGTSDDKKIQGRFWYHAPGCEPVPYQGEGNFVANNGLFLAGSLPKMEGCRVTGWYASTLHFFKNLCDITMKC
jgi:hypothetical protein